MNDANGGGSRSTATTHKYLAASLVSDCQVPSHRSPLPDCEGKEELSAFVLPPPRTCRKDWLARVVGVLANRLKCASTLPVQITRRGLSVATPCFRQSAL